MKKKVKIGVAGCGLISQIMHIPNLLEMREEFEITSLCDLSVGTLKAVSEKFNVKNTFTDYSKFLKSDVEAVLIATSSVLYPDMVIEAVNNKKDVLIEKDMCFSLQAADRMIEVEKKSKAIVMVGHDRRYSPDFRKGVEEIKKMKNIKMVRIHWNGGANEFFTSHYVIDRYPGDISEDIKRENMQSRDLQIEEALGKNPSSQLVNALCMLTGLGTHQMVMIQAGFGNPEKTLFAEISPEGWSWSAILKLPGGIPCIWTVVPTNKLADCPTTLTVYGEEEVISIEGNSPFLKNVPMRIIIKKQEDGVYKEILLRSSFKTSFKEELYHFYDSIITRKKPESDLEVGKENLKALLSIIETYRRGVISQ
ncbi:MAG: Gfo/Idh/MocA family oxidoreductase [Candidatus Firestonebacteria bacterium]